MAYASYVLSKGDPPAFDSNCSRWRRSAHLVYPILFVGLFVTVSAIADERERCLPGTSTLHGVMAVCHAVSLDENAPQFGADLVWHYMHEDEYHAACRPELFEYWFAGVHSEV